MTISFKSFLSCGPVVLLSLFSAISASRLDAQTQTFVSGGQTIRVDVYEAKTAGPHTPIIFLYGSDGMAFLPWSYTALAGWFAAQGYNFYIVHYFDRTNTVFADPISSVTNFPVWATTVMDATTWVGTQPNVNSQRIGIMGMSLGAFLAVYQAGHDIRIKALADWYGGQIDTHVTYMPPTLILHGANDPLVPVAQAYQLQKFEQNLGVPCQIQVYPGEGHGFNLTDELDAIQRSVTFFNSYLGK